MESEYVCVLLVERLQCPVLLDLLEGNHREGTGPYGECGLVQPWSQVLLGRQGESLHA